MKASLSPITSPFSNAAQRVEELNDTAPAGRPLIPFNASNCVQVASGRPLRLLRKHALTSSTKNETEWITSLEQIFREAPSTSSRH